MIFEMKDPRPMDSKRKYSRFNCDGSADVSTEEKERVWGHVSDISLGGFYVSTFGPMAIATEVRFRVEVNGKQVCGVGSVATSHPGVGMGVAYEEVSNNHRQTLLDVISHLERSDSNTESIGLHV
jgi:hypothetical protein